MPAMLRNIPALGLTRELQVRCNNVVDAWADLVRVSGPYSMLVAGATTRSVPAVVGRLVRAARRRPFLDGQTLAELVIDGCDAAFTAAFDAPEYTEAQGRLVNAAMLYRRRQREFVEPLLGMMHVATRSDAEDLGRTLHDLRREVRALRREFDTVSGRTA
jgi:class III poly(R)-hydroxyalkanoic acid synthase PhaE subunit